MRVFVTGGLGFIGSHTCVELLNAGYDVAVLDNLSNSDKSVVDRIEQIAGRKIIFFEGDVRERTCIQVAFTKFSPDAVIHFAGLKAVGDSVQQPLRYYNWNVAASITLFQVMAETNVKTLVFSSSATVYGHPATTLINESSPIMPTSPYGHSKAMIEQILADMVNADSTWRIARLRYFNPAGAHKSGLLGECPKGTPSNLMPYIAQVAAGKLPELKIFGGDYNTPDGTGVRDYIHVMDLADGHVAALTYLGQQAGLITVNFGTGCGYSVLEMVLAVERISGKKVPYRIVERRTGDAEECVADVSKAMSLLGWNARYGLDEICCDLLKWETNQFRQATVI
ncbi:MAG: UDP-glucose 4-epimerase GalE [Methylotenera sp.]|uniref:UDP-glucose 4-epimerase GalE n=1 Tax=Methylotenera sp. TaxID=2051956 RepID=UPI002723AA63|nr:UDP-glucose 4-epimerase GalE [Methylotenera sp.]MDO9206077.1 UDP-glucose 4-epimerase GalE [Methylotenera sp.]MDP2402206.1 UDP-glucose 4-epimerase GalE [Methylotenera sp.]MDP3094275.1 UDP-glucose 4-epimerase GalE [Methylotenera sp.]MDZ4223966.1 UDP-glucose 4-epimerase GalE [Methylotenera sp.]